MRMIAVVTSLIAAATAAAEAPLQPIKDASSLPAELRNATMIAVIHQWSPLDRPWKTVSHVTFPVGDAKIFDGDDRLLIFDPAKKRISPCQVHVVAVAGDGSPEVPEAIFQDELSVGSNVRCVFLKTGPPTPPKQDDEPWTLVTKDDEVVVRMVDALGVKYSTSLFSNRVASHKSGPLEYTEEFFSRLSADPPEQVGIVQPFRFHTFVTARKGEPYFDVQVLIENASDSRPAAEFPFVSLEMETKRAAVREESPLAARQPVQATSIIPPNSEFKFHVAPDHFLMRLRFALAKAEFQDRAKLRMQHEPLYVAVPGLDPAGKPTNSWNSTAAFGPTRVGIPRGDGPHAAIRDRVDREAAACLQGSPLLKRFGPWWVHGEVGGEAPSGVEIAFTCPWAAKFIQSGGTPSAWRFMNVVFDANLARQRFGFWKADGSLWTLEDVLETKHGVQVTPELNIHSGKPHPTPWCRKFGRTERQADPHYKALKAIIDDPAKVAGWQKELDGYTNYDDEHLCRFTQYLFPLVWLGNDPVAKLILEAQASVSMASSNPFPTSAEGEATSGSLAELHAIAARKKVAVGLGEAAGDLPIADGRGASHRSRPEGDLRFRRRRSH
jgi:hypothetical protein